ncbi:tyrosine-type recombinase/integrase [Gluconobacter sp. OJA]|uniref:site-specific integrase n=1 Tax=Gluconobacter sp. OJA TaxID=3145197 RepID=UPI0031F9567A
MTTLRLPYIQRFKDRHGKVRYYFRKKGQKSIPLPDLRDPAFIAAYQAAASGAEPRGLDAAKVTRTGSLRDVIESWYVTAHFKTLEESTKAVYRRLLERMRGADYAANPVLLMESRHVRMIMARHNDSPTTANRMLRLLSMLMEHAIHMGWAENNPTAGVPRMKIKSDGIHSWTDDEIARYEARWPSGTRERRALALLLYTGQRRSDVVKMGPRSLTGHGIHVRQQKTGTELVIPIHEQLRVELNQWQPSGAGTFLATEKGRPMSVNNFYNQFIDWCREAGLPAGCSPHGLRKAAARRLAEAGCTTHQIAAITGHRSLAEVARYTRAAEQVELARSAMSRLRPNVKPVLEGVKPGQKLAEDSDF